MCVCVFVFKICHYVQKVSSSQERILVIFKTATWFRDYPEIQKRKGGRNSSDEDILKIKAKHRIWCKLITKNNRKCFRETSGGIANMKEKRKFKTCIQSTQYYSNNFNEYCLSFAFNTLMIFRIYVHVYWNSWWGVGNRSEGESKRNELKYKQNEKCSK